MSSTAQDLPAQDLPAAARPEQQAPDSATRAAARRAACCRSIKPSTRPPPSPPANITLPAGASSSTRSASRIWWARSSTNSPCGGHGLSRCDVATATGTPAAVVISVSRQRPMMELGKGWRRKLAGDTPGTRALCARISLGQEGRWRSGEAGRPLMAMRTRCYRVDEGSSMQVRKRTYAPLKCNGCP